MGKNTSPLPGGTEEVVLRDALEERCLAYPLLTILGRAPMPDISRKSHPPTLARSQRFGAAE